MLRLTRPPKPQWPRDREPLLVGGLGALPSLPGASQGPFLLSCPAISEHCCFLGLFLSDELLQGRRDARVPSGAGGAQGKAMFTVFFTKRPREPVTVPLLGHLDGPGSHLGGRAIEEVDLVVAGHGLKQAARMCVVSDARFMHLQLRSSAPYLVMIERRARVLHDVVANPLSGTQADHRPVFPFIFRHELDSPTELSEPLALH